MHRDRTRIPRGATPRSRAVGRGWPALRRYAAPRRPSESGRRESDPTDRAGNARPLPPPPAAPAWRRRPELAHPPVIIVTRLLAARQVPQDLLHPFALEIHLARA